MRRVSLVLGLLAGCSFPTSEFRIGAADATPPDVPHADVQADTAPPMDVPVDVPPPIDTAPDAVMPDDTGDAGDVSDAVADAEDVAPDVAPDVALDVTPDVAPDVAPDVPIDVPPTACDPLNRPTCPMGMVCSSTTCTTACDPSESACMGACRNLQTDDENCGTCGTSCGTTGVCRAGACTPRLGNFRIASLGATDCVTVEHGTLTNISQGPIAVSSASVFVSGSAVAAGPVNVTGRFSVVDLTSPMAAARAYETLATNVRDGTVFTFAAGATPLGPGGGTASRLYEIDATTGALSTRVIGLSTPISMAGTSLAQVGIFSGYDRIVLLVGTRMINIALPSGMVTDIGTAPTITHTPCNGWAYWGVAETQGSVTSLVYVQNHATIARTTLGTGVTTSLATFTELASMCGLGVSIPRNRWYFQVSGRSQFRDGMQTLGFCRAAYER